MTEVQDAPAETPAKTPEPAEPGGPSIRMMLTGVGTSAGVIAAVVTFVAGGWIAVVIGGVFAVGGTAAVLKAKSTRPHKTRPGLLATWLTRTRRTTTTKTTGTLPWSLTGNQSKRARTARQTPVSRGRGGLPAVTAKGRARRAAAAAGSGPGRGTKSSAGGARPVAKKAPAGGKAAGPGTGGRGRTPTKTPAKPATRSRLITPSPKTGARPAAGQGTARPRLATAKRTGARSPISNGGKGATILPFKRPAKRATGGTATPARRTGGVSARRNAAGRRAISNPLKGTGAAKRLGGRRTSTGLASRAKRLGTPAARRHRRSDTSVPNRTVRRLNPRKPATKRQLLKTALRVPSRHGRLRLRRPTVAERNRARKTLWRRARVAGRRALRWPGKTIRAAWRNRGPLPFWPAIPSTVLPEWAPNVPDPKLTTERPTVRKHRAPYPQKTGRRAATPKETTTVSSPLEMILEGYNQLLNFDPENARAVDQFMAELGPVHVQAATSLQAFAERMSSDLPYHSTVADAVGQVASLLSGAGDVGAEAYGTFLSVHEHDLARINEPRARETDWDVVNNNL